MSKIKAIIFLAIAVIMLTLLSVATFNAANITFHIHDTYFIASYKQVVIFALAVAGLVILFGILFRSKKT